MISHSPAQAESAPLERLRLHMDADQAIATSTMTFVDWTDVWDEDTHPPTTFTHDVGGANEDRITFTADAVGKRYLVRCVIRFASQVSGSWAERLIVRLYNSAGTQYGDQPAPASNSRDSSGSSTGLDPLYLTAVFIPEAAGDYLNAAVIHTKGTTINVEGASGESHIDITRIG